MTRAGNNAARGRVSLILDNAGKSPRTDTSLTTPLFYAMSHEHSPSPGPLQISLTAFIADAERARRFLQEELDYARATPLDAAAVLDLIRFFGNAFAAVVRLLPEDSAIQPWQQDLLQEAILGRTAAWEWRRRSTSLLHPIELYQMQQRWERITKIARAQAG